MAKKSRKACAFSTAGSMKPANAAGLLAQKNIDGGLIGGAGLKADTFFAIISAAEAPGNSSFIIKKTMSTYFDRNRFVHVFLCLFLMLLILMQNDKMGGLRASAE